MSIPFDMPDTAAVNAANPCCCPEAACVPAVIEYQNRDFQSCCGGWGPYTTTDSPPGDFDLSTMGKLVPLYKRRDVTGTVQRNGTLSETWNYATGGVISETFVFNSSVAYEFTTTLSAEYQKPRDEWPAGSEPYGVCSPESAIMAGTAVALDITIEATSEGIVPVLLRSPEVRPSHPSEVDGEGDPVKLGSYQWLVDGSLAGTTSDPEFTIHLSEGDATCHEYQVRHVCGGNGQWSAPKVFSLNSNPCCKTPEPVACNAVTEGNIQWSASQAYQTGGGVTWSSSYSNTGGGSSSDSGTGYQDACEGGGVGNIPAGLSGLFEARPPLEFIFESAEGYETSTVRTTDSETITESWLRNISETTPDDGSTGWWASSFSDNGTLKVIEKTLFSNDRNRGQASATTMFSALLATVKSYADSFGWGLTLSGTDFPSHAASAIAGWPETEDGGYLGTMFVKLRQRRFRWMVPEDHEGSAYKTQWNIGRFHDRWLSWRSEYFEWAVAKYEFLQKPKPGDDDYPKLSDYGNDAASLAAAIDALDSIVDPGSAPVEPADLKPEITDSPPPWVWADTQAEQPDERIDDCDPTKYARELHEPAKPERDDYGTDEQFENALNSYQDALADYQEEVAERKASSKRQSQWHLLTPDQWRHWSGVPDKPALPEDPTDEDRDEYERQMKRYRFLLNRYNTTPHGALYVCNVRHTCNIGDPNGEIENWDRQFLTTELPPLDPAKEDPAAWADWYQ